MIKKNCLKCNKEFKTYPSKIALGRGKYCSKSCADTVTLFKPGVSVSPETQIKKGVPLPQHWKDRMKGRSVWNAGTKGICKPNITSFKPGQSVSPETQFKAGMRPEDHPMWQGGKSYKEYPREWNHSIRESIRERDGYKCRICGVPQMECVSRLHVHHIDYDKKNLNNDNLITLCVSCHMKTNCKPEGREKWIAFFKGVMPCVRKA